MEDQMDELFQQLLDDGYTVEQAADMAYIEFNKTWKNLLNTMLYLQPLLLL